MIDARASGSGVQADGAVGPRVPEPLPSCRAAVTRRIALLALVAVVMLVAGCSSDPEQAALPADAAASSISQAAAGLGRVEELGDLEAAVPQPPAMDGPQPSNAPLTLETLSGDEPVVEEAAALMAALDEKAPDAPDGAPGAPGGALEPGPTRSYTVVSGDTLLGVAMQFDVPMAAIQLQNDLGAATNIRLGQVLEIPAAQAWSHASRFWVIHEVATGETLGAIAARYGLALIELEAANQGLEANFLSVGQPLILPLGGPAEVPASANVAPAAPVAPPVPPTPSPTAAPLIAAAVEPQAEDEVDVGVSEVAEPEVEPEPPTPSPEVVVAPPPADAAALATEVYRLINAERSAHGLPALAWNGTLARAAQLHADDCYARGWCSHTGSDGSTYRQRIIREGYNPVRWSECWAWYETPERAMAMWMNETPPNDPHRRTILSSVLAEVGVGVVPGNGRGYYFIADFGTPAQ